MVNGTREIIKHRRMKLSIFLVVIVCLSSAVAPADAQVNVTQFHNHESRDGLYIDSAFTQSAAANLTRDLNFDGIIAGNVYAQPLYIEGGPSGKAMIIAATESDNVYGLDAVNGSIIWQRNVGEPVSADDLICTKFDPMGITGTPIVDLASRPLFFDAMITPDGGQTKKHLLFSLNVDTGDVNPGWPIDIEATASYNGVDFIPAIQQQRPALGVQAGGPERGPCRHQGIFLPHTSHLSGRRNVFRQNSRVSSSIVILTVSPFQNAILWRGVSKSILQLWRASLSSPAPWKWRSDSGEIWALFQNPASLSKLSRGRRTYFHC
jgi:hypothetical protein